ncbi:MAG: hypothetical protein CMC86_04780 [Flavobacteriaceae bacterium]|nr:hypothetical protein [Flavobacteriaceae bacterium]|tara:strand:- start:53348 stop:54685 length:1338 start_codon:yes stop_codon:yes gene_type:complete
MQNIKYFYFAYLCIFLSCGSDNNAANNITNQNTEIQKIFTLGGTKNESGQSVVKTPDGGYAVLGYTQSMDLDVLNKSNNSYDYWLIKFDAFGNQQWQKVYGGSDDDRGQEIINTSDGGYAIIGSSKSQDGDVSLNSGFNDFWVLKISNSGNLIWEKSFGYSGSDNGFSIIQTQDNGYLITGVIDVTSSDGQGNNRLNINRHAGGDYWVIKINSVGNLQWSRYFGGSFTDTSYALSETQTGNFIIVGSSDSDDIDINNNKGSYDFWVLKISSSGELIWEKSFGGSEIDEARDITITENGDFLIVGDSRSVDTDILYNNGAADIWIIKINADGQLIWEKTYGGTSFDGVQSIQKTLNNYYIVAGNSRSSDVNLENNNGQNDAWFFKIDSQGVLKWQNSVGGSDIDLLMDIVELENGTIIAVGNSNSNDLDISENKGFTDLLIIEAIP